MILFFNEFFEVYLCFFSTFRIYIALYSSAFGTERVRGVHRMSAHVGDGGGGTNEDWQSVLRGFRTVSCSVLFVYYLLCGNNNNICKSFQGGAWLSDQNGFAVRKKLVAIKLESTTYMYETLRVGVLEGTADNIHIIFITHVTGSRRRTSLSVGLFFGV